VAESSSEIQLRVRYAETDQMGFAYYGAYAAWLEVGRVEFLRERGLTYREVEAAGQILAVRELHLDYLAPARYDDLLAVRTRVAEHSKSRVVFESEVCREGQVLSRGRVVLACLDRSGRPQRLSDELVKACAGC
jgi:acyl-CoA thioester hydrolase